MDPTHSTASTKAENQPDGKPDVEFLPCKKNWPIFWLVTAILTAFIVYACIQ